MRDSIDAEKEIRNKIEQNVLTRHNIELIQTYPQVQYGYPDYLIETKGKRIAIEVKGAGKIRISATVGQLLAYLISEGVDEVWVATSPQNYENITNFMFRLNECRVLYAWVLKKIKYLDSGKAKEENMADEWL